MLAGIDVRHLAVAAAAAVVLMLGYFVATSGWMNLANPFAGLVAVLAGAIGFTVAVLLDRRRRTPPARSRE
jgi:CHASE2 domain-containing sensor protein